jgi:DNA-binding NarL/FixJ family response regulator
MAGGLFTGTEQPRRLARMHPDPASAGPLRVVVVDADDRVRESLSRLLCIGDKVAIVGTAGEPEPALEVVAATEPDVVVVDPRVPGLDGGAAFIRQLRDGAPNARVLVMSASDSAQLGEVASAADGVVRKTFRATELLTAILGAAAAINL